MSAPLPPPPADRRLRPALLSAAVFPGLGQLVQRRYAGALGFGGGSAALLFVLLERVWVETTARMPADPDQLAAAILDDPGWPFRLAAQIQRDNGSFFFWITAGIVLLWAFSVWDAWRAGRSAP